MKLFSNEDMEAHTAYHAAKPYKDALKQIMAEAKLMEYTDKFATFYITNELYGKIKKLLEE